MSVLPPFSLHRFQTVPEVLDVISWDDLPYVGGTELLLAMRAGLLQPRSLVDLKQIAELGRLEVEEDTLVIGATVTHRAAADHQVVQNRVPILPTVLNKIGNPRIRAAGTLAGNLCFAEPKSDLIPVLFGLGAIIRLESRGGTRDLPIGDFILGAYFTAREPDELLTSIMIPLNPVRRGVYLKYQVAERPTVGVAALQWSANDMSFSRVVVGAAGELPVMTDGIDGAPIDIDALINSLEPIDDLTGSPDYKRHVTRVFVQRALAELEGIS
jgi:carbon-monoxide dehydrogenase medium subunit